ncbi:MAG: pyrroline-5-carboxylate reductase, partial [Alphaproteobacteria bacterium]|nr:pyrroline-5-carboxylate reductase [Alphaproteobacteria bacterium]
MTEPLGGQAGTLLVGAGNMGGALLARWIAEAKAAGEGPAAFLVAEPAPGPAVADLLKREGIAHVADVAVLGPIAADTLVLAVKPQGMGEVLKGLAFARPPGLVLTVAAGLPISFYEARLGRVPIVRAMPNMPALIGKGVSVAVANGAAGAWARARAEGLLAAAGAVRWVEDEELMHAVTAVSGSGPAYVFLLAECLEEAAIAQGLAPELARDLARATVSGAGALLDADPRGAGELRAAVTSPGGTTAAALGVLTGTEGLG